MNLNEDENDTDDDWLLPLYQSLHNPQAWRHLQYITGNASIKSPKFGASNSEDEASRLFLDETLVNDTLDSVLISEALQMSATADVGPDAAVMFAELLNTDMSSLWLFLTLLINDP